jgi:hypothetical protein
MEGPTIPDATVVRWWMKPKELHESLWISNYNPFGLFGRLRLAQMARMLVVLDLLLLGLGEAGARAA